MAEHKTYTYCITDSGELASFTGKDREANVLRALDLGHRRLLTHEFSRETTQEQINYFGLGLTQGYHIALRHMQEALGFRR